MNHNHFLLSALVLPIVFTLHGQEQIDQKIQQLKDAWYQKVHELAELGEKIVEKNKLLISLQNDIREVGVSVIESYSEKDRAAVGKAFPVLTKDFYNKLFHAIRDNVDVKGFLIRELLENKGDFFKNKEDLPGFLDSIKLDLIQIIIEGNALKKNLYDYENCLQKMAEIDHELKLLGQPTLLCD
jgi:hypothetical protein